MSRGTVLGAYDQLAGEGYLDTTARTGTHVAADVRATTPAVGRHPTVLEPDGASGCIDLRPGIPDPIRIDSPAWRAAWHQAASQGARGGRPMGRNH